MQQRNAVNKTPSASLIDLISRGFAALRRCWWVALIPLAIDLFYWLGPRLSIAPLIDQVRTLNPEAWNQLLETTGADAVAQLSASDLRHAMLLNPLQPLLQGLIVDTPAGVWNLSSIGAVVGWMLVVNAVALVLATVYLTPLAQTLGDKRGMLRRMGYVLLSLVGITLLVAGTLLGTTFVVVIIAALTSLVAMPLANVIMFAWIAVAVWLIFVTSFAFDAAVLDGVGPFRAIWRSFRLVQRSLFSALGLWLLTTLIIWGMEVIWGSLATTGIAGLVVASIGNAYITTGLAAAHLAFYQNRTEPAAATASRP